MTLSQKKITGIVLLFTGLFFAFVFLSVDRHMWGNIHENDLTQITTVLAKKPEIRYDSKGRRSLELHLQTFPNASFINSGLFYTATESIQFCSRTQIGDTITISLLTDEYKKKITKEKSRTISEKILGNKNRLTIYGLTYKNYQYVNLTEINKQQLLKKSDWMDIAGLTFIAILILFGIRQFRK